MFYRMPKILGVTWPKPCPFWGKLFMHPVGIPCAKLRTKFEVSSWNTKFEVCSLSSFEDVFDCMPKILGVTWPRPRLLGVKLLARLVGFPYPKLCTKFEVCSLSSFEDMFDCMPKILGVTWPRPRPFWGKIIHAPARVFQEEAVFQIWSL